MYGVRLAYVLSVTSRERGKKRKKEKKKNFVRTETLNGRVAAVSKSHVDPKSCMDKSLEGMPEKKKGV